MGCAPQVSIATSIHKDHAIYFSISQPHLKHHYFNGVPPQKLLIPSSSVLVSLIWFCYIRRALTADAYRVHLIPTTRCRHQQMTPQRCQSMCSGRTPPPSQPVPSPLSLCSYCSSFIHSASSRIRHGFVYRSSLELWYVLCYPNFSQLLHMNILE